MCPGTSETKFVCSNTRRVKLTRPRYTSLCGVVKRHKLDLRRTQTEEGQPGSRLHVASVVDSTLALSLAWERSHSSVSYGHIDTICQHNNVPRYSRLKADMIVGLFISINADHKRIKSPEQTTENLPVNFRELKLKVMSGNRTKF